MNVRNKRDKASGSEGGSLLYAIFHQCRLGSDLDISIGGLPMFHLLRLQLGMQHAGRAGSSRT